MSEISIAVIIPMFNSAKTIERALHSVLSQTVSPDEVYIVDDCSTDNSLDLVEQFISCNQCSNMHLLRMNVNSGPGLARNHGWAIAKSRYVAFLDADDAWSPIYLSQKHDALKLYPDLQLLANEAKVIDIEKYDTGNLSQDMALRFITKGNILYKNIFMTSSVLLARDLPYRFPQQKYSEDYALWLDVVFNSHEGQVAILTNILSFRFKEYYGVAGLSAKLWAMEKFELLNYYHIWKKGYINTILWFLISLFSFGKYIKRVVLTFMRKIL